MPSKHTPEPWRLGKVHPQIIVAENHPDGKKDIALSRVFPASHIEEFEAEELANATRIVACVNACAGINPEAVPLMRDALSALIEYEDAVRAHVEIAAVDDMDTARADELGAGLDNLWDNWVSKARAAIEEAEGKKDA